ncbi:MAG: YidC/Oxa1 family membrane protein insertase, partial [Mariprofundaceae bacterium]|nr:YidC/Oxa1 family membrane protein insertase [Mariprofundaceae bacterium]
LDDINVRLVSEETALEPGQMVEHKYLLYNGPLKVRLLANYPGVSPELVERYNETLHLSTLTDYPSQNFFGAIGSFTGLTWLIVRITNLLHWLLNALNTVLPYGLCIVVLTVIVRGMLFPISRRQAANMQQMQEKMAKLAPDIKKIKEKYKDDYQAQQREQMELMRKHGINPLASLGGCLMLFAQFPIFISLWWCLQESIHLRLERFLWIPSLAAPDMLIWWSQSIPLISGPSDLGSMLYLGPYFNLLPLVTVAVMLFQQQKMMPPPTDEQQEMQQKMMKFMMIFMGFIFYKVAAGLCIYFIASSLWGMAERKFLPKKTTPGQTDDSALPFKLDGKKKSRQDVKQTKETSEWRSKLSDWWQNVLKEAGKQQQARKGHRGNKRPR